ncbi:hypothetical protein RAC69_16630 [Microbacterium sp. LS_15]|uniref:hypothetical protein n=1 Tax=Microbacterium sp. LS_15 TaxID=3055790 RepID=UPI0035BED5D6
MGTENDADGIDTDRTDISSEPSPGAEENDVLGTEDNKSEPPRVLPSDGDDDGRHSSDVEAERD